MRLTIDMVRCDWCGLTVESTRTGSSGWGPLLAGWLHCEVAGAEVCSRRCATELSHQHRRDEAFQQWKGTRDSILRAVLATERADGGPVTVEDVCRTVEGWKP